MRFALAFVAILLVSWASTGEAYQLTNDEIAEFKRIFSLYDNDGDGIITTKELATLMLTCLGKNPTEDELQEVTNEIDPEGTGTFGIQTFLAMLEDTTQDETMVQDTFQVLDKDNDGFITATDLVHAMGNLSRVLTTEEAVELIRAVDSDGDGQISYDEFVTMMSKRNFNSPS